MEFDYYLSLTYTDFGKFNCSSPDVKYNTTLQALWTLVSANQTSFLIEYAFPSEVL